VVKLWNDDDKDLDNNENKVIRKKGGKKKADVNRCVWLEKGGKVGIRRRSKVGFISTCIDTVGNSLASPIS
jgi:hypothetical protein